MIADVLVPACMPNQQQASGWWYLEIRLKHPVGQRYLDANWSNLTLSKLLEVQDDLANSPVAADSLYERSPVELLLSDPPADLSRMSQAQDIDVLSIAGRNVSNLPFNLAELIPDPSDPLTPFSNRVEARRARVEVPHGAHRSPKQVCSKQR